MENALKIKVFRKSILFCIYLRNGSSEKFYVVVNYYLVTLSFKFHEDLCIDARTNVVNARAHVLSRVRRLWLVRVHLCTDLYEIWYLWSQDSNWPPHKISGRSELTLRRYLQNNIDFPNTLIFIAFPILSLLCTSKAFE